MNGRKKSKQDDESIPILRGRQIVSTLTGAFGQSLKETRLTALLGYIVALAPERFLSLFGFKGIAQRIELETRHAEGRSDILVETNLGVGIVEAKINSVDPLSQSSKYPAKWIALLTHRVPPKRNSSSVTYVQWQELGHLLSELTRVGEPRIRILSKDLLTYLKEHHLVTSRDSVEVYAREINEPVSLELFLKGHMYTCKYEAGSRIAEALYFAPHFGAAIARHHPGVFVGISYVARVKDIGYSVGWKEFEKLACEHRTRIWWNKHKDLMRRLRRLWPKGDTQQSILFLDEPRLVFNPPIRKSGLQAGSGWLSKRFFSFDELFAAWGD